MTKRRGPRRDINLIIMTGRITDEPVFAYSKSNSMPRLYFKMLTIDERRHKEGTWVKVWGPYAEMLSRRLVVGTWVLVQGSKRTTSYKQQRGGWKTHRFIRADTVMMLDGDRPPLSAVNAAHKIQEQLEVSDDDLGM